MKISPKNAFVAVLFVGAIFMVGRSVLMPVWRHWSLKRAVKNVVVATGKPGPASGAEGKLLPSTTNLQTWIATATVKASLPKWLELTRDPFQTRYLDLRKQMVIPVPAAQLLKLSGIWVQTGSRLAVINQRLVHEGDVLEGFKIERIEDNGVTFSGTGGREVLTIRPPKPSTNTNAGAETPGAPDGSPMAETDSASAGDAPSPANGAEKALAAATLPVLPAGLPPLPADLPPLPADLPPMPTNLPAMLTNPPAAAASAPLAVTNAMPADTNAAPAATNAAPAATNAQAASVRRGLQNPRPVGLLNSPRPASSSWRAPVARTGRPWLPRVANAPRAADLTARQLIPEAPIGLLL